MHMALKPAGVNGNGALHVSSRGLRRRKLSRDQRVGLAADWASGQLQLEPSLGQACELFDVTPARVRAELKAREAGPEPMMNLVTAWDCASEAERAEAIQGIGVSIVWDVIASIIK